MKQRTERDFIGEVQIPADALYGIHAQRAVENFPDVSRFNLTWYKSIGLVKKGCYLTYESFRRSVDKHLPDHPFRRGMIPSEVTEALIFAADEVITGEHFDHFIVPAINGGAGTSINLNVNEVITNRALQILGEKPGSYHRIDPFEHANVYQSTNDVIPTALKIAAIQEFQLLEQSINTLRSQLEELEKRYRNVVRMGYTQMQAAVPSSYGILFGNYADALSRDWWRTSRCIERIKVVNLGGSAIGTGMAVPRYFIMEVVQTLRSLTGMPLTRAENNSDTTSNLDALVEVHAVMKSLAVNIEKMCNDVRLLASDLSTKEIQIPQRQVGSSVMPGKVNPVICEYAISVSHRVYANDAVITSLAAQGCLDLNPYLPLIGDALLNSIQLLAGACQTLEKNLFVNLTVSAGKSQELVYKNGAVTTALIPLVGYRKASEIAELMKSHDIDVFEANAQLGAIEPEQAKAALAPDELLRLGFSVKDLYNHG
jgi:aspartate ammonia-lyase